ncbi:MAG: GAF domain-containing sensor histidine kinase [Oscillochloridaceae bacterium umkhey_bin13]
MRQANDTPGRFHRLLARLGRGPDGIWRPLNDALLAGGLLALLVAAYAVIIYVGVLAIGGINTPDAEVPWWLNLIALLLISLGFVPVSRWMRRGIDQLIYGWPDDPYGVLSRLQAGLLQNPSPQAIVPVVVASVTATLKLPYAAITRLPDGETFIIGTPPADAERASIPLTYGETVVGNLEVAARRPGATLSASELHLLYDLARQVGITLYAAQLSEALQDSRTQLVAAREEERRRIRRDLHDGLGPTLASMRIQLGVARRVLRSEPATAEALLDELRSDVAEATGMIRRLVYDLRPPMLDEHGLVGALQSLGRLIEPTVLHLDLPEKTPPLSAAVEVALYRIAAEALRNVARHACAPGCVLALDVGATVVELSVSDSGAGLPTAYREGVGIAAMRERAEELGGSLQIDSAPGTGVTVMARIPWRPTVSDT